MVKNKRITDVYHRQDIKIPIAVYDRICEIANDIFEEPIHHRSGKPIIKDTLIYLIQLGIEAIDEGKGRKEEVDNEMVKKLIGEAILKHVRECHQK